MRKTGRKKGKARVKRTPELDAVEAAVSRIKSLLKAPAEKGSILPALFTAPLFFAAVCILPQAVLFFINLNAYGMVRGMDDTPHGLFAALFAGEAFFLLCCTAFAAAAFVVKKRIAWGFHFIFLAFGIALLWYVTSVTDTLIPRSVENWIVPRGELLYLNYLCIMPVIFYSLIRLSSISIPVPPAMQFGIIGGSTLVIPLTWYVLAVTVFRHVNMNNTPVMYIVAGAMVASTAALFFGLFRALVFFIHWYTAKDRRIVSIVLSAVVGIAMPLAGLLLNALVPFPADFQRVWFYVLVLLNGAVLVVPRTGRPQLDTVLYFLRVMLFPVTAYFFLVFLPFYPLAVPLVFAFGAGFLVLTPALLLVVHGRRILDDYKKRKSLGTLLVSAAMIAVIPLIVTGVALADRAAIHGALAHVYRPSFTDMKPYAQSRSGLARALENLNEMNNGNKVPFVSGWYGQIVFGGLTLSDTKLDTLYRLYLGRGVPDIKNYGRFGDFFFNVSPRRMLESMGEPVVENPAIASSIAVTKRVLSNGVMRSTVSFTLRNTADSGLEEYRTAIRIPDGVFVSGYRLRAGTNMVSGRITEKKTALWIYAMITSRQRDPGLLFYRAPNELMLRVFPFAGKETRVTEIDFLHAEKAMIMVGEKKIALSGQGTSVLKSTGRDGAAYLVPASAKERLPKMERAPYAYFIVDASKNAPADAAARMKAVAAALKVPNFRAVYANYDILDDGVLWKVNAFSSYTAPKFERRGGFDVNRAVKYALIDHDARMTSSPERYRYWYPVIVIITSPPVPVEDPAGMKTNASLRWRLFLHTDTLDYFERLAPESPYYYVSVPGGKELERVRFGNAYERVVLLSSGKEVHAVPAAGPSVIGFRSADALSALAVSGRSVPIASIPCSDNAYADALAGVVRYAAGRYDPQRSERDRKDLLMLSKKSGVMLPSSAYIVVETYAQNRMIDAAEKKKMNTVNEAEITKSPEPSVIALIAALVVLAVIAVRRRVRVVSRART